MIPAERSRAARELLAFYLDAGVDALIGEHPVDRLTAAGEHAALQTDGAIAPAATLPATPAAQRTALPQAPREIAGDRQALASPQQPVAPDAAVMAAREAARTAQTLAELEAILAQFEGCALKATASRLVFADGNPEAPLMFVGEAPGADEDREGLPFVGRSGRLLDRMMAAIGIDRQSAYVANIIPWRPPGNRTPTPLESQTCLPFIQRQIALADPDILVCLGAPAAQTLIGVKDGIMKTRGRWFTYHTGNREIRAIATLHPAYLLRQPLAKRLAWRDFLSIKAALAARS